MATDQNSTAQINARVMHHWGVTPVEYLGRHLNENWLVMCGENRLVLRGYAAEPIGDIAYELEVLRRLHALGWPVPIAVEEPLIHGGRTWCLFQWLPGSPRVRSVEEGHARGRLLAELHESMRHLTELEQREGCCLADELVCDPELTACLQSYERIYPQEGHIMRWHLEQAQAAFARTGKAAAGTLVLHGDFSPWNLLFNGERLTGILDFEATHLNYRVADFALSWRGEYDEVIDGYQEVTKLTDLDMELLVPVYWSWLFLGVTKEITPILAGQKPAHDFKWTVDHLLRRSKLFERQMPRYPGRQDSL